MVVDHADRGFEVLTPDVVEVDVESGRSHVRHRRAEQILDGTVVVVEGGVGSELTDQGDLLRATCTTDHGGAPQFCDLYHGGTDSTGG